ncbi:MAG: hypothetical protein RL092_1768 [Bacteroidota bacterium]
MRRTVRNLIWSYRAFFVGNSQSYPLPSGNFGEKEIMNKYKFLINLEVIRMNVEYDITHIYMSELQNSIYKKHTSHKPQ